MPKDFGPRYDSDVPEGHAFQERRSFHPDDIRLRSHGFKIHSRPRRGEPLWSLGGEVFTHSRACEVCGITCTQEHPEEAYAEPQ